MSELGPLHMYSSCPSGFGSEISDDESGPQSDERKSGSSEERIKRDVLQELHKKLEEAKQKVRERGEHDKCLS